MSKFAIINDLHFGYKSDSEYFLQQHKDFFSKVFFPYVDKHNITEVLFLGDLVDNRNSIGTNTLHEINEFFIRPLMSRGIRLVASSGNHDHYTRKTA